MWASEVTVKYDCLDVTIATFCHSSKRRVCNDERHLNCNMQKDDGIPLVHGTSETTLIYNEKVADNGDCAPLACDMLGTDNNVRWFDQERRYTSLFRSEIDGQTSLETIISRKNRETFLNTTIKSRHGTDCRGWADVRPLLCPEYAKLDIDIKDGTTYCQLTDDTCLTRLQWGCDVTASTHSDYALLTRGNTCSNHS